MAEDLDKYLKYPYTQMIKKVEDEVEGSYYVGRYLEVAEARTHADSLQDLEDRMQDVLELSIQMRLENDEEIPEAVDKEDFSGKFTLRLPKSLHRDLSIAAEEENVSLNQYLVYKLAQK